MRQRLAQTATVLFFLAGCRGTPVGLDEVPDDTIETCSANTCGDNATCSVVDNATQCDCNDGFEPNADACTDIDECDDGNNGGCGDDTYWLCEDNDGADPTCTLLPINIDSDVT